MGAINTRPLKRLSPWTGTRDRLKVVFEILDTIWNMEHDTEWDCPTESCRFCVTRQLVMWERNEFHPKCGGSILCVSGFLSSFSSPSLPLKSLDSSCSPRNVVLFVRQQTSAFIKWANGKIGNSVLPWTHVSTLLMNSLRVLLGTHGPRAFSPRRATH